MGHMSADAPDMVSIPRAEWDALQAELRRLRRQQGDQLAADRIHADPGPETGSSLTRSDLTAAWGFGD